jgi:hypothetical protein
MTATTAVMPTTKNVPSMRYITAVMRVIAVMGAQPNRASLFRDQEPNTYKTGGIEMANESKANDFNARDYLNSMFIKKADLRQSGPRRLTVKAVEQGQGRPGRDGSPAKPELHLVFSDDTRLSLGAQVNLRRMVEAYGDRTAMWIGKTVEVYFSPDVVNPGGGEPGGIRLRLPDTSQVPRGYRSDLEEPQKADGAEPPKPPRAPKRAVRSKAASKDDEAF